jgi:hypothetical protein
MRLPDFDKIRRIPQRANPQDKYPPWDARWCLNPPPTPSPVEKAPPAVATSPDPPIAQAPIEATPAPPKAAVLPEPEPAPAPVRRPITAAPPEPKDLARVVKPPTAVKTRRRPKPEPHLDPDLEPEPVPGSPHALILHARHCRVCAHPLREEIEHEFLRWVPSHQIVRTYELDDPLLPTGRGRFSLYRHARAVGLYPRRARNIRTALEHMIESAAVVSLSGSNVLQAIRMFTQMDEDGRTIEGRRSNVQVTYRIEHAASSADAALPPGATALPVPSLLKP